MDSESGLELVEGSRAGLQRPRRHCGDLGRRARDIADYEWTPVTFVMPVTSYSYSGSSRAREQEWSRPLPRHWHGCLRSRIGRCCGQDYLDQQRSPRSRRAAGVARYCAGDVAGERGDRASGPRGVGSTRQGEPGELCDPTSSGVPVGRLARGRNPGARGCPGSSSSLRTSRGRLRHVRGRGVHRWRRARSWRTCSETCEGKAQRRRGPLRRLARGHAPRREGSRRLEWFETRDEALEAAGLRE